MDGESPLPFECAACAASNRPTASYCASCGAPRFASETMDEHDSVASTQSRTERRDRLRRRMTHLKLQASLFGLLLSSSLVLGLYGHFATETIRFEAMVVGFDVAVAFAFAAAYWSDIRFLFVPRSVGLRPVLEVAAFSILILAAFELGFRGLSAVGVPFANITHDYLESGFPLWAVYVWISVVPAVSEEVAFRGVIQQGLLHIGTEKEAWLIQAALFGVLHLSPIAFVTHTLMGLAFGWLRERTASIYPGMLVHAAWNAWVVLQETSG